MSETKKSILILDANAFISGSKITELGKKYRLVTTSDVISQLKDQKTKQYFSKIPFDIQQKDFDDKSLQFVKQFAKKTGDIGSLSDIDMQLIALAHTLYTKQSLGQKLRKQPPPIVQKVVQEQDQSVQARQSEQQDDQQYSDQQNTKQGQLGDEEGWITVPSSKKKQQEEQDSDIDQQQGWITPNNYQKKMAQMNTAYLQNKKEDKQQKQEKSQTNQVLQNSQKQKPEQFQIALISADFAIQNVCTQMGVKLISLDGRVIQSIRRFIWQCYLCWKQYKITQNKVKLCTNCGYNSLSKISYSIDTEGNVTLHRKKGWKPNLKVQEWKQKKFQEQQKKKKHQHQRRKKKQSIFDAV